MCQEIGRVMVEQQSGKIINVSSIGAKNGDVAQAAYAATKAAVMNFSRALSREFAPLGINVNSICPGIVLSLIHIYLSKYGFPLAFTF